MAGEKERVDAYLDTVKRMEPEIAMVDTGAALASIAISLRRLADAAERIVPVEGQAHGLLNLAYEIGNNIGSGIERGRKGS